jgi:release factor glutamine methyltransferase
MNEAAARFHPFMTVAEALREAVTRLRRSGIDNPRLEARLLLAHALGCSVAELVCDPDRVVTADGFGSLVMRRAGREPLAYILGQREFWSLEFKVSPATLIPRPDTETVVEAALAACSGHVGPLHVLDLGTGTGCLLLSVLHERPDAFGIGIDLSPAAAAMASGNAAALGLDSRAAFLCADWATALRARFDLILSNPPYISTSDIGGLMPEVAGFEPSLCLDGGADGCDAYRRIIPTLPALLTPGGSGVLELGAGQEKTVAAMAAAAGLPAEIRKDLSGTARAIVLRRAVA